MCQHPQYTLFLVLCVSLVIIFYENSLLPFLPMEPIYQNNLHTNHIPHIPSPFTSASPSPSYTRSNSPSISIITSTTLILGEEEYHEYDCRLFYSITPGRSGSGYLAFVMDHFENVYSVHEEGNTYLDVVKRLGLKVCKTITSK